MYETQLTRVLSVFGFRIPRAFSDPVIFQFTQYCDALQYYSLPISECFNHIYIGSILILIFIDPVYDCYCKFSVKLGLLAVQLLLHYRKVPGLCDYQVHVLWFELWLANLWWSDKYTILNPLAFLSSCL